MLPQREDMKATCVAVTEDFCIIGTNTGSIEFFYFADWTLLNGAEYRHEESIRSVFPNRAGECLDLVPHVLNGDVRRCVLCCE